MIKLFDKDMSFIKSIGDYAGLQITEELGTGYKTCQFLLPYTVGFVKEEQKVEIDNYLYVVKEVNMEESNYYEVYCKPYFGKLLRKSVDYCGGFAYTLPRAMNEILEDTDWTFTTEGEVNGVFTLALERVSAIEAIEQLRKLYNVDLTFDTLNKEIKAYKSRGSNKGAFFFSANNLRQCKVQSNTYDMVTRLIPIGKDGLTINLVNDNKLWVEDYSYTDEVITGYWVQSSIDNPDDLKQLALNKVAESARPQTTYKIKATALPIDVEPGDSIRVIDEIKGLDKIERVAKKVVFPQQKEESYIECGSPLVLFDQIYKDMNEAAKIVNKDTLRNIAELKHLY